MGGDPTVNLGGRDWTIPPLSARRIIRFGSLASSIVRITQQMPEEDMLKIYEAIFIGVSQGMQNGEMTFEKWLDEYSITFVEILAALPIVARQAGMEMSPKKDDGKGEAKPQTSESQTSSPTGTIQ